MGIQCDEGVNPLPPWEIENTGIKIIVEDPESG